MRNMITDEAKEKIRYWRREGISYGEISERLNLSANTVKSFCQRNHLAGSTAAEPILVCRQCGKPLPRANKKKQRKFCSDFCRHTWWNAHPEYINRRAFYSAACAHCGRKFQSYGNQKRKYCSHACYVAARFGRGGSHDGGAV